MLLFISSLHANDVVLYDAINHKELPFTSASQYEELSIDALNKLQEVGYSYFVFANEVYESQRLEKLHEYFKTYAIQPGVQEQIVEEAKAYHRNERLEQGYGVGYNIEASFRGYAIDDMDLRPIAFLGNTLTFSYSVDYYLQSGYNEHYTYDQLFVLNLDNFSFQPIEHANDCIDEEALRAALIEKWTSITDLMPSRNWNLIAQLPLDVEAYDEEEPDRLPAIYADSLISYAISQADLSLVNAYWNGGGVMVRIPNAVPWFKSSMPLDVQLHLSPWEAQKAFANCPAFNTLNNAPKEDQPKWTIDPFDGFIEAFYVQLNRQFMDFVEVDDKRIKSIECIYRDNPADSQYTFKVDYMKGKAQYISRGNGRHATYYDSIFWDDDHIVASVKNEEAYTHDNDRVYRRNLRLHHRNKQGNTLWYLATSENFSMQAFTYFPDRLARFNYSLLSEGRVYSLYHDRPNWYMQEANGYCFERGGCVRVDSKGRLSQRHTNTYAYKDGKLLQILGERDKYTLFFYDDKDRLEEVVDQITGHKELHYYYKEDETIPYRVEKMDDRSRNTYYIIHRK